MAKKIQVGGRSEAFESHLPCKLNSAALLKFGGRMAALQAEIDQLEDELSSVKADFKSRIECREAERNVAANCIRTESETRAVPCTRSFDYASHSVVETRDDTLEELKRRKMTDDEAQGQFNL